MSTGSRSRYLLSLLVAAVLFASAVRRSPIAGASAGGARVPGARATLRVGMWTLWHDREVVVAPGARDGKILLRTCAQCTAVSVTGAIDIRADGDALSIVEHDKKTATHGIWIEGMNRLTAHGESVLLPYAANITARGGELTIAVTMPVESYVERVVASESGTADSAESLKALAIVVRTFALHEAHGHADYDVCDSTHCQLLHWSDIGNRRATAHVETLATAGETLWFRGGRALAYFHKDCGGRTASPTEIWPKAQATPYLPSQPDRFCSAGGSKEWASELTRSEISAALVRARLAKPGWQQLTVEKRGESGRAVTLRLDANTISAETFLLAVGEALGWNKIPSTWFEVSRQGDRFLFHGRGWGHGVGLCQKGSAGMAAAGRTTEQILAQYFPGSQTADEATARTWKRFAGEGFALESLDAADASFLAELNLARHEATERSGLYGVKPITIRAFASTEAFRDATLAPGWVAAFTEENWIATQPLHTLAERKLLRYTLRHEFLHALVETEAGPNAPLWLREGLVETWSAPDGKAMAGPALKIDAVDQALAHAKTERESEAAHRTAGAYAVRLLKRYGRAQVLVWLRSGLPSDAIAFLGQR